MIGAERTQKIKHDQSAHSGSDGKRVAVENQKRRKLAKQLTACLVFSNNVASSDKMDFDAFVKNATNNKNVTDAWKGNLIPGFEAFAHAFSQGDIAALLEHISPLTDEMTKSEVAARLERLTRNRATAKQSEIRKVWERQNAFAAREVLSTQSSDAVLDLVILGLQGFMDWVGNQKNDYYSEFSRLKYAEIMLRRLKLVRLTPHP
tara:strand:- start:15704 stop:16318 length:615 start_codon:yes stop_codon:yes gene_type:complete